MAKIKSKVINMEFANRVPANKGFKADVVPGVPQILNATHKSEGDDIDIYLSLLVKVPDGDAPKAAFTFSQIKEDVKDWADFLTPEGTFVDGCMIGRVDGVTILFAA